LRSPPRLLKLSVAGVCHFRIASVNVVPLCRPLAVEYPAAAVLSESFEVVVGQPREDE
jgi:hypothetical protein